METYLELVAENVTRLNTATGLEWHHGWTGGGHDAYFLNIDHIGEEGYYMITVDATAPTTDEEWQEITLGRYTFTDDEGTYFDNVSTFSDVVAFFTDGNPHANNDPYTEPCEECGAEMTSTGDGWIHANTPTAHKCHTAYRWGVK